MVINLKVHRFLDCDNFPEGVNRKVKEKMSTMNLRNIDCEHCKARILASLVKRDWKDLSTAEVEAFDVVAAELSAK